MRGSITINGLSHNFEFGIHNYQRKINYVLRVIVEENELDVVVKDKDYHLKRAYYESFWVINTKSIIIIASFSIK